MTVEAMWGIRRRHNNIQAAWAEFNDLKRHASPLPLREAARKAGKCTLHDCEGIDLLAAIKTDLEPWRRRGGITLADTDAAQKKGCAAGEEDGHYFDCVAGWVIVLFYATETTANAYTAASTTTHDNSHSFTFHNFLFLLPSYTHTPTTPTPSGGCAFWW